MSMISEHIVLISRHLFPFLLLLPGVVFFRRAKQERTFRQGERSLSQLDKDTSIHFSTDRSRGRFKEDIRARILIPMLEHFFSASLPPLSG